MMGVFHPQYSSSTTRTLFFGSLCLAIEELWAKGLVHGDFHTSNLNVLVTRNELHQVSKIVPVILDFGRSIYAAKHDAKEERYVDSLTTRELFITAMFGYQAACDNLQYLS